MKKFIIPGLGALIFIAPFAFAETYDFADSDEIMVYGSACQKISNGKSISSARLQAGEAATFNALQNLEQVQNYRHKSDEQTFNSKVYQLIDNHLYSLNTNTLKQTADEVCVEINAFVNATAINEVFTNNYQVINKNLSNSLTNDELELNLPPKPDITINQEIAYEKKDENNHSTSGDNYIKPLDARRISIFVKNTEFYNGTATSQFFSDLQKELEKHKKLKVFDTFDNQDYTIITKVLKAKVDHINKVTSRMQIVISMSLINNRTQETFDEHQNRFVLFTADDDAQKVASGLIRTLFSDALPKLLTHIKHDLDLENNSILTPVK